MADDYFTKISTNIVTGLNTFAHGLINAGAVVTPDEYHVVPKGANPGYFVSAVDSTNIYVSGIGQFSADVYCRYNHSVIR